MAEELTIISRLQQASKTEAEWEQSNPVLKQGELAISIDKNKIKIGDGTTTWKKLPYYADEIAWDKVASKPTTIAGYGITDVKITSGVITLGGNTITPLTSESSLNAAKLTGTASINTTGSSGSCTGSAASAIVAKDFAEVGGIATALSQKLNKLDYEWNRAINFGSTGRLLVFKGTCYDTNITIDIDATTNVTYHGTLVIATQNSQVSEMKVYGDTSGTITQALFVKPCTAQTETGRILEVYFKPAMWSKNLVKIRATGVYAAPTNICEIVSEIPDTATYTYQSGHILNALDIKASKATTLSGYGITDAKIESGVITLGTNSITPITSQQDISGKADKATTLKGYGITDAKIENGVVTLGGNTIVPLTQHQSLANYIQYNSALQTNNPFSSTKLYRTKEDNRLYAASKRFVVTHQLYESDGKKVANLDTDALFDGDYELYNTLCTPNRYAVLYIGYCPEAELDSSSNYLWTYGQGSLYLSFYASGGPGAVTCEVYSQAHQSSGQAKGWHVNTAVMVSNNIWRVDLVRGITYITAFRITYTGKDTGGYLTTLTELEYRGTRSTVGEEAGVTKYAISQKIFGELAAPRFIGPLTGNVTGNCSGSAGSVAWGNIDSKPSTIGGYGISDAKIANGVITLGGNTITPLTSHQSLAEYAKTAEVTSAISNAINGVTSFEYLVVDGLPESGKKGTIYLVKHPHGDRDVYDEFIWVGSGYEKIGNTDIDLSGYLQKTDIASWAKTASKPSYSFLEITSKPTTLSGYGIEDAKILSGVITLGGNTITPLTSHQDISGKADKATTLSGYGITDAKITSGVITLGGDTITPLTSESSLNAARLSGTASINTTGSSGSCTGTAASATVAKDYAEVGGIATALSQKLNKLDFEWNRAINFGSTGNLLVFKGTCYDTNITIDIDATTSVTYHGTFVIATQNSRVSEMKVYGDPSGTITQSLYVKPCTAQTETGRIIEIYFKPAMWSKNLVKIRATGVYAAPTNICESVNVIPETAIYTYQSGHIINALDAKATKATTLSGYGITDAKIANGAISLGGNTITPLTQHQDISGKVDKESGKGLSSNDYTTAEKNKLAGIASGATANQGTVTNVVTGNGLSGGPITTSGSINLKIALAGSLGGIVPMIGYESPMPLDPFSSDAIDSEVLADEAEKDTIALPLQVDSEGHAFIVIGQKVIEKLRELLGK